MAVVDAHIIAVGLDLPLLRLVLKVAVSNGGHQRAEENDHDHAVRKSHHLNSLIFKTNTTQKVRE